MVKIQGVPDYEPPKKDDPWLVDPLKIGKKKGKKPQPNLQNERQKSRRNLEYLLEFTFKFEKISFKTHQK